MSVAMATLTKVPNYVNGQWIDSKATEWLDVTNPATGEVIAQTPLSSAAEVGARNCGHVLLRFAARSEGP